MITKKFDDEMHYISIRGAKFMVDTCEQEVRPFRVILGLLESNEEDLMKYEKFIHKIRKIIEKLNPIINKWGLKTDKSRLTGDEEQAVDIADYVGCNEELFKNDALLWSVTVNEAVFSLVMLYEGIEFDGRMIRLGDDHDGEWLKNVVMAINT
jgi:hypothetical protein